MIDQVIRDRCTGCNMCGDLCPEQAISYQESEEGFWYPIVDATKCVECSLCVDRCPVLSNETQEKNTPTVYEAWLKDETMRLASTSGGVYYALASYILEQGGYIVGAVYADDYKSAYHYVSNRKEDLARIMGSKYFQSNAEGIYQKTKALLEAGELVLFCGTPCQCVALQNYLGKDYPKLYLVDFICLGVNSPLAFKRHIEELEQEYNSPVKKVQLKNKKTGWQSLATYVEFQNGCTCHQDKRESLWVKGFVSGGSLYLRESCYDCHFKGFPRKTDITIGDFWGIKDKSERDMFNGISVVLVSSSKGETLFDACKPKLEFEKHELEDVLPGNPSLLYSARRNANRDKFFVELKKHGFGKAVKNCKKEKPIMTIWIKIKRMFTYDVVKFIYYNYFSKNIVRDKGVYLCPHKGTILDLSKDCRIYIKRKDAIIGDNRLRGSKAETHIRMSGNAKWYLNNGCKVFYNTVIEVKNNAVLNTDFFTVNGGSVIICAKGITFGEDTMLGRNITIYDTDYHQVVDENYRMKNFSKPVIIEPHVWLTSNIMVQKGVTIGEGSLIAAYNVIRKDVPPKSMVVNGMTQKIVAEDVKWLRRRVDDIG